MNLGIYINHLNNKKHTDLANAMIEHGLNNNLAKDFSIFYDNIGPLDNDFKCGMFNSTDIWNFNGKLLVFSLDSIRYSIKMVNNFNIYYIYGLEEISVLNLLDLLNNNIKVVCMGKQYKKEYYRITGTFPIGTSSRIKDIMRFILGDK